MRMNHIKSNDPEKFIREAKLLEKIDHPNIVRYKQYFLDSGIFYLVMDLCKG